jgi:hypothetical protein
MADYGLHMLRWEELFRVILSWLHAPSDKRVLTFREREGGVRQYREIDFVAAADCTPRCFVEVKFREKYEPLSKRGVAQLAQSIEIGRHRWPNLQGVCINVFLGYILQLVAEEPVFTSTLSSLSVFGSIPTTEVEPPLIWISGKEFTESGMKHGLLSVGDIENFRHCRNISHNPPVKRAGLEQPGLGSLGDALGSLLNGS